LFLLVVFVGLRELLAVPKTGNPPTVRARRNQPTRNAVLENQSLNASLCPLVVNLATGETNPRDDFPEMNGPRL
jgi:hypothetical protein